jgi:hypothetical protein
MHRPLHEISSDGDCLRPARARGAERDGSVECARDQQATVPSNAKARKFEKIQFCDSQGCVELFNVTLEVSDISACETDLAV